MRVPRAWLALVLGVALLVSRAQSLAAQGATGAANAAAVWNDERTMELVRAATARRVVQLADTGLRDYTARATGFVTFLAQLGEGFLSPPVLIKSDQLAVEVYWGAPDRSKQRIIGRRDTLLLPTDQQYHRDHLGIVQNNFPETIRLGDGDEVRDVPHPLSALGHATYDFRIADSLAIRTADRAIDVMMINVRPKDDRVAAAVGAIYIERQSASVVRMTFSFTRAALRDRQLEDVSVILENGLVEGRFWLPRRQEIEIRRTLNWMDFPVRGIIRGRWEVCCIVANTSLPPERFVGREIVDAPPQEQRAYEFPGAILDALPEEVRALDAEEVRAVQEEARALVRAGALARVRSTALAARGASEFVRFNRTEGLALGAGLSQRLGWGLSASVTGRYGLSDEALKAAGTLAWRSARGHAIVVRLFDDFAEVGETREVSGLRNSIAAQEFGSDWTDLYGVRGHSLRLERALASGGRFHLEYSRRSERPLAVFAASSNGTFEPAFAADSLARSSIALGWERTRLVAGGAGRVRSALEIRLAAATWGSNARDDIIVLGPVLGRVALDLETSLPIARGRLVTRTLAAQVDAQLSYGPDVPAQDGVVFGGPISGPGLGFHALVGERGLSQRLEWQSRIPFIPINLGRFGRVPSSLVLAPYLHAVWLDRPSLGEAGWHPAVGLGTIGLFELLRVDVARGLRDGRWMFSLDIAREFWPVL